VLAWWARWWCSELCKQGRLHSARSYTLAYTQLSVVLATLLTVAAVISAVMYSPCEPSPAQKQSTSSSAPPQLVSHFWVTRPHVCVCD
jgi:hypothetical protein